LPLKGNASYYSIPAGGNRSLNAVWTYETPLEAMAQIKDYVAFYPDRVDAGGLASVARCGWSLFLRSRRADFWRNFDSLSPW
jgi:hypothetical protein